MQKWLLWRERQKSLRFGPLAEPYTFRRTDKEEQFEEGAVCTVCWMLRDRKEIWHSYQKHAPIQNLASR
jgi:hypothetical protein